MKRFLFVMGCVFALLVAPVTAQSTTCDIDLASTITLLVQAQASASSGETEIALAQIAQAREKLEAFEALCGAVVDVPPTPMALELSESAQVSDSMAGGAIFDYPEGWALLEDGSGTMVATSADVLERDFSDEPPPFAPGEALIYVGLSFADRMGLGVPPDADPIQVLNGMAAQVPPSFGDKSEPVAISVNDRPAGLLTVEGDEAHLMLLMVQLENVNGQAAYGQLMLLTAPGELNAYEPTLQAVAESIWYHPGP